MNQLIYFTEPNMLEMLYRRRSVRKFLAKPVEKQKIDMLKQSLLLAPSGKNKKPLRFIFISDETLIRKTAEAKPHGVEPLKTAPLAVAVVALTDKSDVWIEDCSIASIMLQLQAESEGLSSCWVQMRKRIRPDGSSSEEWLRELLGLPDSETVTAIIAIGYADEKVPAYKAADLDYSRIEDR